MPDINIEPAWFDFPTAARYSGVGRTKLYEGLNAKALEGRKLGKKTLISRESLDRFLANLPRFGEASRAA